MKYTTKLVLKMFLDTDIKRSRSSNNDNIDLEFQRYFTDKELRAMISWLHEKGSISEKFNAKIQHLEKLNTEELFEIVEKRSNILAYYINVWRFENDYLYQPEGIKSVFEIHGITSHYLFSKAPQTWSREDYSEYQQLLLKFGYLIKAYGIYDKDIPQDNVQMVTSPPERFFDSYDEAEEGIQELVNGGVIEKDTVHILFTLVHS